MSFRLIRYLIIAVLAYFIDMGGYILLVRMSVEPLVANVVVKVLAAIFGFFAHRRFTFLIKDNRNIGPHAVRYFGLALMYTPASTLALFVAVHFVSDVVLAKFVCDVVLFVSVYWITSKFAFFRDDDLEQSKS